MDAIIDLDETSEALDELYSIAQEWAASNLILEMDWSKIKQIDFQQLLREKNELARKMASCLCQTCPNISDHYGVIHSERILQQQVADLAHSLSSQNLELLPDYHQRVQVLKDFKFIDENSVVQIKGRVACEVIYY